MFFPLSLFYVFVLIGWLFVISQFAVETDLQAGANHGYEVRQSQPPAVKFFLLLLTN